MNIVGFGDFLIHFSPCGNERFLQADSMSMKFTGAEANVCAALAFWGENVQFVTKLPKHHLALKGEMFLKSFNIKTDFIEHGNGRMGLYFLEKGHAMRPSTVIYDRQGTAFTNCGLNDFDWETIFKNSDAFYLSGITPSLSNNLLDCCEQILKKARSKNISVFYDVNLRPTICDIKKSREIYRRLSPYITHLISNEEHLKQLTEYYSEDKNTATRLKTLSSFVSKKTNIKNIAITVRETINAHKTIILASYSNGKDFTLSPKYEIDVVDRVGSGDAFSAGIVYSVTNNFSTLDTVNFSIASCALKHTINDDINFSTVEEIKTVMSNKNLDVNR